MLVEFCFVMIGKADIPDEYNAPLSVYFALEITEDLYSLTRFKCTGICHEALNTPRSVRYSRI